MPIRGEGLAGENDAEMGDRAGDKLVYVLHPNCAVEEM